MGNMKNMYNENVADKNKIRSQVLNEVEKSNSKVGKMKLNLIAMAIIVGVGGGFAYATPIDYVGVDINPSVQLGVNMFDKVVKVKALNEDGKKIVKESKLKNKDVDVAVAEIVESASEAGYISKETEDNFVLVTTYTDNDKKAERLKEKVNKKVEEKLDKNKVSAEVINEKLDKKQHMTDEIKEDAVDYEVSNGKMMLIHRAIQADDDYEVEELVDASIKDIMNIIKDKEEKVAKEDKEKENKEEVKENEDKKEKEDKGNKKNKDELDDNEEKKTKEEKMSDKEDKKNNANIKNKESNENELEEEKDKLDKEKNVKAKKDKNI